MDNTLALQLFSLFRFAAAFLSGVMLVKMGWLPDQVEQYELLLLVFGMFSFFWVSGTQNAFLSLVTKLPEQQQSTFFKVALSLICFVSLIAALLLYGFAGRLYPAFSGQWSFLLAFYLLLNVPSLYLHIKFLIENRPKAIFWFGVINFSVQLFAVLLPLFWGLGVLAVLQALLFLAAVRFLYYLYLVGFSITFSNRIKVFIKKWYVLSIPLSLHILLGVSPEYVDAFLIEWFQEEEGAYAIYKYGARELPLLISFIASISTAALPILVKRQEEGLDLLKSKTNRLSHILFPLSIILVFISTYLFELAYDEVYRDSALIFNIYLLILLSRIPMPHTIITARQDNYFLLFVAVLEFVANVGLSLLLLPVYGLAGIAMGTVLANFIQKFFLILFVRIRYDIRLGQYISLRPWLGYSFTLLLSFFLYYMYLS